MASRIEKYHKIFTANYGDLCNYASLFIPRIDAEDVVSDLFAHLIEVKDPEEISKSYLLTSVRNRCLNRIRNGKSDKMYQDYIAERLTEFYETPDESTFMDVKAQLTKAVRNLPERYRQVFILSRFTGLSNKEIAEHLNLSVRSVESYLTSSLKFLKNALKDYLFLILMTIC